MTKRKSNIELLRIICMICLVAHHFTIHGNLYLNGNMFTKMFSLLFAPLGKMCYDVFMVISCYFLADSSVKSDRFWKVWREVLFYNVLMMMAAFCVTGYRGMESIKMLIGSIFPMLGASQGYAIAYLWFLTFLPFIKMLQEKMSDQYLKLSILILSSLEILNWVIGSFVEYNAGIRSEISFFALIYFLTVLIKKNDYMVKALSLKPLILCGGGVYIIEYFIWAVNLDGDNNLFGIFLSFINNQRSPLNILFAYIIFYTFLNMSISYNEVINKLASTTFAILLIHDSNYFRNIIWNIILSSKIGDALWKSNLTFAIGFMGIVFGISCACSIIDLIRQMTVEKWTRNSHFFKFLNNKLNMALNLKT